MSFIDRWAVAMASQCYDSDIMESIKIAEEFNLFNSALVDATNGEQISFTGETPIFTKVKKGENVIYDFFYKNLHIHYYKTIKEMIYSIRIKKESDKWVFGTKDGVEYDFSHPINSTFEVYVWYHVPVLDITSTMGSIYTHGNWDKYVRKIFKEFTDRNKAIKCGYAEIEQFNEEYK